MKHLIIAAAFVALSLSACSTATSPRMVIDDSRHYLTPKWVDVERRMKHDAAPKFDNIDVLNDTVNQIQYVPDLKNYGVNDYYQTPAQFLKRGGDCEDYAIAKYWFILKNNLAEPSEMKILILRDTIGNLDHAVLEVKGFILDNQNDGVMPLNDERLSRYSVYGYINR